MHKIMRQILISITILLLSVACTRDQKWRLDRTEPSPLGNIIVEHYHNYEAEDETNGDAEETNGDVGSNTT